MSLHFVAGDRILLLTGRHEWMRPLTVEWFLSHGIKYRKDGTAGARAVYDQLFMFPDDDHRDDFTVKREMIETIRGMGYDPRLVYEDRQRVVDMWRGIGITCFQVAPGNF